MIESKDQLLSFKNCECNGPPECPTLMAPYYTFTPDEILARTTTLKGKERVLGQVAGGVLLLAAPSIPGAPGSIAALLGLMGLAGTALDPADKAGKELKVDRMASNILNFYSQALRNDTNPIAVIQTGGSYGDLKKEFRTFLHALKNSDKNKKAEIKAASIQYQQDFAAGRVIPVQSCEDQILDLDRQIKKNTDLILEKMAPSKAEPAALGEASQEITPSLN